MGMAHTIFGNPSRRPSTRGGFDIPVKMTLYRLPDGCRADRGDQFAPVTMTYDEARERLLARGNRPAPQSSSAR